MGDVAIQAIKSGQTNVDALATVRKEFPESKTSMASINWYRNKLRSDGVKGVKTNRELTKAAKKAAPKKDPLDD